MSSPQFASCYNDLLHIQIATRTKVDSEREEHPNEAVCNAFQILPKHHDLRSDLHPNTHIGALVHGAGRFSAPCSENFSVSTLSRRFERTHLFLHWCAASAAGTTVAPPESQPCNGGWRPQRWPPWPSCERRTSSSRNCTLRFFSSHKNSHKREPPST